MTSRQLAFVPKRKAIHFSIRGPIIHFGTCLKAN
jgi:hypothetical protein